MRRQTLWRMLLAAAFLALMPWVAQAEIDPTMVQKLLANDKAQDDEFGVSVSVDGDTAVIGAWQEAPGGYSYAGAAYIFIRSNGIWTQQAKLTASDKAFNDRFGMSVSVSGDTALIGAYGADPNGLTDAGAAYVFTRSGTSWTQQAKLTASDKAANDCFGYGGMGVSVSGDTAVIGAYTADPGGLSNAGAAYVFTRSGTSWTQQAKLTASDKATSDGFGLSVSVSGDTAMIGAINADIDGISNAGAAYVFTRSGTSWTQQTKLTDDDKATGVQFGWAVSVDGDTAVIGAPGAAPDGLSSVGAAYVFTRSGTSWTQQAKMTADDKAAVDQFGARVSVDGDTAVIGSRGADPDGLTDAGAAYAFTRSGTSWTQQVKMTADDKTAGAWFGWAVSVSGDTAVIGAFYADPDSISNAGAAYVFSSTSPCGSGRALPAKTWLMTAPSCQPTDPPGIGIDAQYGNDIPGGVYGTNWISWKWDAASQRYPGVMAGTDPLVLGEGNWVYSLNAGNLALDGTAATTEPCSNYGSGLTGQCFAVDLTPAAGSSLWQIVGHTFPYSVSWADVRVAASLDGGVRWTTYTPSQAETASLMDKTIQRWSGSAYEACDDSTPGMTGVLQPQEAFWVRIKPGSLGLSGFKLLIPAQ